MLPLAGTLSPSLSFFLSSCSTSCLPPGHKSAVFKVVCSLLGFRRGRKLVDSDGTDIALAASQSSPVCFMMEMSSQALRVLGWAEFIAHPYRLHDIFNNNRSGELIYDRRQVINLTQSTCIDDVVVNVYKDNVVLTTTTQDQLALIHDLFLRRLLLLKITIYHTEISSKYSVETVSIVEDDFAVLLNGHHPSIRQQIKSGFQASMRYLNRNQHFCLELDISDLLLDWYMEVRDAITSCDDIHSVKSRRTRLCVTNHTLYKHGLDCSPKWILFLCICWILFVPCYKVYRKLTCADIRVKLKCDVTSATYYIQNEATRVQLQDNKRKYDSV